MPLSPVASVAEDSAVPPGVGHGLPTAAAAGLGRSEGVPAPPPCGGGEMRSADIPLSARALKVNDLINRFDAVSAYMRKMDRYGLSDF